MSITSTENTSACGSTFGTTNSTEHSKDNGVNRMSKDSFLSSVPEESEPLVEEADEILIE